MILVSVQSDDFNLQHEYDALCENNTADGAVVTFVGRVRDLAENSNVTALTLEHYPSMTEKTLTELAQSAKQRWPISQVRVIHRYGTLGPADQIVLVAVSSPHRTAAFESAQYLMDFLKTNAPFWKKEHTNDGDYWVEAKQADVDQERQWSKP